MAKLHQTNAPSDNISGISLTSKLEMEIKTAFQAESTIRCFVITVMENSLGIKSTVHVASTWASDFDALARSIDLKLPYFIVFFKDKISKSTSGAGMGRLFGVGSNTTFVRPCVLISYIPDSCNVRDKMVFSSSKATLRALLLGQYSNHVDQFFEYQCDNPTEFCSSAFSKYSSTQGPLSLVEEELRALPKELSREDAKAGGFSLLARLGNPNAAATLPSYAKGAALPTSYGSNTAKSVLKPVQQQGSLASIGSKVASSAMIFENAKSVLKPVSDVKAKSELFDNRDKSGLNCVVSDCKQPRSNKFGYCANHANTDEEHVVKPSSVLARNNSSTSREDVKNLPGFLASSNNNIESRRTNSIVSNHSVSSRPISMPEETTTTRSRPSSIIFKPPSVKN